MKTLKKAMNLWGTYLALIPFVCLTIYLLIAASITAPGAVANSVSGWAVSKLIIFIVSAVIFAGIGILLARTNSTDSTDSTD
ncbi:MAG: hypothetical protein U9N77_05960 [Thermodesulfobacteriota bacterium]|nr:hypothetical protein [Thermodesulfobacteriota bacterium]